MGTEHNGTKGRDELLRAVVCGDLEADAPEVVAAKGKDPSFADELEELLSLARELDADAEMEARELGEAREFGGEPAPVTPASEGVRWWRPVAAIAAAAVILLLLRVIFPPADPTPPAPHMMNPGDIELLVPEEGMAEGWEVLRWTSRASDAREFEVRIWFGAEKMGPPDLSSGELNTTEWRPEGVERGSLPAPPSAVTVVVVAMNAEGRIVASSEPRRIEYASR